MKDRITVLESQGPLVAPSAIIRFKKKKLNSPNENVADIVVVEVNELYKEQWNSGSEKKYYVEVNCAFSNSDFNNESEFPLTASKMHKTSDISSKRKEKNELNNLNYDIVSVIESKSFSTDEHIEKLMISLDLKELNEKFAKDVFLNQYQDGNLIDRGTIRKRKGVDSHTWPAEDNVKITYQFRVRAENGLGSSPIGSVVGEKVEVNVYGTNLNQEEQILQGVEKLNPVADEEIINDMSTETNDLEYSFLDDDRYSSQQNSEFNDFSRPGSPFNDSSTIYPTLGQFGESFPVFPDTWHFKLGFGDQFLHNWKNTFYLARALYYTVEMDGKIKLKLHYVGYNPKKHDKEIVISKYIKKVNINNKLEIEKRLKKHFKQFSTDLTAGKDYNNLFEIQEENGWFDSNSEACLYKDVITEFENNFEQGQILVQKKL
ncbi:hypothetical protein HK099_007573 [Clydaea vesicula]|uniref:Uncharacterized protein n=1 Tax=Clydaea vesicula TaxID=447962 RepID=A0AAD5XTK1_9FUNG|nr:hypothetical protein HK099_007573 [Clydaea vesicula]